MRTGGQLTTLLLLMACLGACDRAAQPGAPPLAQAAAVTPVTAPTPRPETSAADAGLAIAIAREQVDRAVREQTLHVQKQLREQEREQKQIRDAAERGDGNERCLSGQRMRRVANGWVQAGTC